MSTKPSLSELTLDVNGEAVSGQVEGRTSLADFLRDDLDLTGTHLGCEHGVCGACTVEMDGQPVRACITLARACEGRSVRTIEGGDDDPVMAALQEAFMQFHGLQCGFCTPGMLVACRDIILRHRTLSDERIRIALGGNICRCTGYVGIVNAVRSVFERRDQLLADATEPTAPPEEPAWEGTPFRPFKRRAGQMTAVTATPSDGDDDDQTLRESITVRKPADEVWAFLSDVERVVPCVPGARLLSVNGNELEVEMEVSLGAIRARFRGNGRFHFDDQTRKGRMEGEGRDARSGSSASGAMDFAVIADDGDQRCRIEFVASYSVTGPLSQFSRGGLVKSFVGAMARMFADNVQTVLSGGQVSEGGGAGLSVVRLTLNVIKSWFQSLFRRE
ncbi:2Fe-2S iron-sulfur cluster-binding protein [Alloalcanivorax sp. C16-2]|uniref:2Fe-2S iron-sulfur cluster-binding protein n=1 Tax=Alloalcanivorax sp. C16-2 TaxID=3390052 RepID=UPI003970EAB1